MEWQELVNYIEQKIEHYVVKNDTVMLISHFVIINDMLTMNNISKIQFVRDGQIWFNDNIHMDINNIEKIYISQR